MKKIALGLLGALAGLLLVVVALGATRPSHYEVSRSLLVQATPEQITPMLTDLHAWNTWNPWDAMEPTSTKEYSDPASGVGAWYTWRGDQTGSGRMEIISISPTRVDYALHFTAPMEDTATVHFDLAPVGDTRTNVTWSMEGEQNLMGRIFGLFMDMDTMIGGDFEQGLTNLAGHFAG
jgi:hypothetical protein